MARMGKFPGQCVMEAKKKECFKVRRTGFTLSPLTPLQILRPALSTHPASNPASLLSYPPASTLPSGPTRGPLESAPGYHRLATMTSGYTHTVSCLQIYILFTSHPSHPDMYILRTSHPSHPNMPVLSSAIRP